MKTKPILQNIPDGWQEPKLASIGVFSKGSGITKEELSNTGHNAIRYGELYTKFNFKIENIYSYIPTKIIPMTTKIKYGDILFAGSGETIEEIGKSAAYLLHEDCYAGGDLIIFRPKNTNSLFLSYLLNVGEGRKKLRELGQGQAIVHIYKSDIENIKLNLPPLPEQNRIVAVLETWDKAIEKLTKKIESKGRIKKGLKQNLLTGKKRLIGYTDKWRFIKLGQIASFKKGKGLSKSELLPTGRYEAIHYGELFTKYNEKIEYILSKTNSYSNMFLSKKNDILMPTSDVTPRGLSTASYVDKDGIILGGDILVIRSSRDLNGLYFAYYVKSNKKEVIKLVSGSTVFHLYGSDMAKFKLNLPPLKEQESISNVLTIADKEIKELKNKLSLLKDQKKYLLNNLITGKIRTTVNMANSPQLKIGPT